MVPKTHDSDANCTESPREESERFEQLALEELRRQKLKITKPRIEVIRALGSTNSALSPYAILNRIVESGGKIDVVSVYRIVQTLERVGLVHHVGLVDGYYACRKGDAEAHQAQLFVCERCGCVTEAPAPPLVWTEMQSTAQAIGFKPSMSRLETLGACAHCCA